MRDPHATAPERRHAWFLDHSEASHMPGQAEVDAWYYGAPILGGQGRDAETIERDGNALVGAFIFGSFAVICALGGWLLRGWLS